MKQIVQGTKHYLYSFLVSHDITLKLELLHVIHGNY